jgi:hypothetical protein
MARISLYHQPLANLNRITTKKFSIFITFFSLWGKRKKKGMMGLLDANPYEVSARKCCAPEVI